MSFEHHYPNRKDWLGRYYRSQRFDRSCRPHGGCPWCEQNRRLPDLRREAAAEEQLNDFLREEP